MNTYVYATEYIIGSFKYLFIGYIGKVWVDITWKCAIVKNNSSHKVVYQ